MCVCVFFLVLARSGPGPGVLRWRLIRGACGGKINERESYRTHTHAYTYNNYSVFSWVYYELYEITLQTTPTHISTPTHAHTHKNISCLHSIHLCLVSVLCWTLNVDYTYTYIVFAQTVSLVLSLARQRFGRSGEPGQITMLYGAIQSTGICYMHLCILVSCSMFDALFQCLCVFGCVCVNYN